MLKFFWVTNKQDFEEPIIENEDILDEELDQEVGQVAVDILETPYEIIILAPIAWITIEDVDLWFKDNILTIKWERQIPEIYARDVKIKNRECFWGRFIRNIILPENLDFDTIKANIENNLLVITIKKLEFSAKRIDIDTV